MFLASERVQCHHLVGNQLLGDLSDAFFREPFGLVDERQFLRLLFGNLGEFFGLDADLKQLLVVVSVEITCHSPAKPGVVSTSGDYRTALTLPIPIGDMQPTRDYGGRGPLCGPLIGALDIEIVLLLNYLVSHQMGEILDSDSAENF
jgi:hypothetical protein